MRSLLKLSRNLSIFISICLSNSVIAQPILTASGIKPVAGDSYNYNGTNYLSPGFPGANVTWNFASLSTNYTSTVSYVASSSTSYGFFFPASNVCATEGGARAYYNTTSNSLKYNGGYGLTGPVIIYSDPSEILRFPFTYGDSYTDQLYASYADNGTTYYRSGSISVNADSYGTLILPNGTYNDVTRVKCYSTIRDSSNTAGTPSVSSFNKTEYYYYLNGNHYPIAYLYSNYVQGTTYTGGSYIDNVVVGLEEEGLNPYAIDLYPSPASNEVKIKVHGVEDIKEIILTDVAGKVVQSVDASLCIIENDTYSLDLISIANGIYFVTLRNKEGNSTTQKLVISK